MQVDIDRLRAAAEKATPGPWGVLQAPHTHGSWWEIYADGPFRIGVLSRDNALPNGRHVAACDPTTIIALCDEVARLRQELGQPLETERECERMRELLRQCWYWFDNHDDNRMTSFEIHKLLKEWITPKEQTK